MQVLLSQGQNPDSSLRLAQVIVDADQGFNCSLGAALVLMLFVVQSFGKGMALLCQSTKRPEEMQQNQRLPLQEAMQRSSQVEKL